MRPVGAELPLQPVLHRQVGRGDQGAVCLDIRIDRFETPHQLLYRGRLDQLPYLFQAVCIHHDAAEDSRPTPAWVTPGAKQK